MSEFVGFGKIGRWNRKIQCTEKIDGTNSQVYIWDEDADVLVEGTHDKYEKAGPPPEGIPFIDSLGSVHIAAGSRKRWITPEDDNYRFAAWVDNNFEDLKRLGPGRHFGEWWGRGIQRKYGLDHKRFSLFNINRWHEAGDEPRRVPMANPTIERYTEAAPISCHVVPIIDEVDMVFFSAEKIMDYLKRKGSLAAPGFMDPEGIVIYHTANGALFKKTFEKDDTGKEQR